MKDKENINSDIDNEEKKVNKEVKKILDNFRYIDGYYPFHISHLVGQDKIRIDFITVQHDNHDPYLADVKTGLNVFVILSKKQFKNIVQAFNNANKHFDVEWMKNENKV